METPENSRLKIGGLGRAAIDITVTAPAQIARDVLLQFGFAGSGVQIVEAKDVLLRIVKELERHGSSVISPGDPVSNTLHMMGVCQQSRAFPLALYWFGTTGPKDHELGFPIDPLDSLRRVAVVPYCIAYEERDNLAVCIISKETRRVITILAQSNQGVPANLQNLPVMDVFLVLLVDLLRADDSLLERIWQSGAYALIVGDTVRETRKSSELLEALAGSDKLKWIIGRFEEFERLRIIRSNRVEAAFQQVEVIGTQGPAPVRIWSPKFKELVSFDVPAIPIAGNDLGAGDAYAGGYLYGRITQNSIADSHLFAVACAKQVLEVDCARANPENDLNLVFGQMIDRSTESHDDGWLFERVRLSPGHTLVSPGQKGIDQIAIAAATKLGLPSYCFLPRGLRTETVEGHTDCFGDSYVRELNSPSYRYRTWLTVFIADGTLLWDFYGGEGSASTRDACHALGRPFLDLTSFDENYLLQTVSEWIDRHGIRVINIAGTRQSRLTDAESALVKRQSLRLLRFLAHRGAKSGFTSQELPPDSASDSSQNAINQPGNPLRIGIPNSAGPRLLFESFLLEVFGLSPVNSRSLLVRSEDPALEVVFARPRDLPTMVKERAIDVALCGSDVLYEEEVPFETLLDTGLFPCFIVLVGKDGKREVENGRTPLRVGSQYPRLASKLLSRIGKPVSLRTIQGTAEAWIRIGLLDAAIDTWQTGSSADANNLHLHQVLMNTSLVVVGFPSETTTRDKHRFINDFSAWLAGKFVLPKGRSLPGAPMAPSQ